MKYRWSDLRPLDIVEIDGLNERYMYDGRFAFFNKNVYYDNISIERVTRVWRAPYNLFDAYTEGRLFTRPQELKEICPKPATKEMTVDQISEELGYPVKVVGIAWNDD